MSVFRLKIQQFDANCLFDLSWGQGQQLHAALPYPPLLTDLYREWQQAYLRFYQTLPQQASIALPLPTPGDGKDEMRARVVRSEQTTMPVDWRSRLEQAEIRLLSELHYWLRSPELFDIRAAIAQGDGTADRRVPSTVFLTCMPLALARLPWEQWQIGTDFAAACPVRIVRTPGRVAVPANPRRRSKRPRILAILGDDTGLNFKDDRAAIKSLERWAEVQFVGWQLGQTADGVRQAILEAIADDRGWDLLLFAGHSNENTTTGGELSVAPGVSMSMQELTPRLIAARERGLQFALFNSCSGLDIAASLINLGLSQVAIMREPIHNRVAQEFLIRFLQALSQHRDVQESLDTACQFLQTECNHAYPSAHLVPSLFFHPGAEPFRLPRRGWKHHLRQTLPTRPEAVALVGCLVLSVLPPIQGMQRDVRLLVQSIYRQVSNQVPTQPPPVTLIQIDTASVNQYIVGDMDVTDRAFLAQLVRQLTEHNARIVGIDVLMDRRTNQDAVLRAALEHAIQQNQTWFVFGSILEGEPMQELGVIPEVANPAWSMQGFTDAFSSYHMTLPFQHENCADYCPLTYLLSLIRIAQQQGIETLPQPALSDRTDLQTRLLHTLNQQAMAHPPLAALLAAKLDPALVQIGFNPILDFSIPWDRVYTAVAAVDLLERSETIPVLPQFPHQVVLIVAADNRLSLDHESGADQDAAPLAKKRWWGSDAVLTGGESLAYEAYHHLTQRWVMPVPDWLMIAIAALMGRVAVTVVHHTQPKQWSQRRKRRYTLALAGATLSYGLISLQLYISVAVLLPWFLPSVVFWSYLLPVFRRKVHV